MCYLIGFTFPVMWYLMKANFRLPLNLILLRRQYLNTSFFLCCMPLFLLTNMLYGLHYPLCLMVLTLARPDSTLLLHMCRNRLLITVFPHRRYTTRMCRTSYMTRVLLRCLFLRCQIQNSKWPHHNQVMLSLMPYNSYLHKLHHPRLHDRAQDFKTT
jgi:hypothetical protein